MRRPAAIAPSQHSIEQVAKTRVRVAILEVPFALFSIIARLMTIEIAAPSNRLMSFTRKIGLKKYFGASEVKRRPPEIAASEKPTQPRDRRGRSVRSGTREAKPKMRRLINVNMPTKSARPIECITSNIGYPVVDSSTHTPIDVVGK